MCLAIPSKVIALQGNTATLETLGVQRQASLDLIDEPLEVGDFVLLHVGFVVGKIDTDEALESLKLYAEMIAKMDQDG
ncbi:Hydrogenase assembly chaperone HypC/HupF [Helicobacter sp. NHP19-012]|uniref:Hydrogenase assembly chaperone HypC/HupF n=1 Tax=Helicobacter gastrofelis TaxID=2849642 RepID=A0ABM7SP76_9HELI|nr:MULTISPECIES: HypC/HybG/HupF family hydrogenase formation chaperone [unclassified Helicobacter]BCZ19406.1 Hydrogenase assembly chaperone HypC/HupF [Helicobacter sp. NHP19-012]GMB96397.1 Hydrogenase assembly chaperone HypC/HupF [Helicobacter sp. NHP22-001]